MFSMFGRKNKQKEQELIARCGYSSLYNSNKTIEKVFILLQDMYGNLSSEHFVLSIAKLPVNTRTIVSIFLYVLSENTNHKLFNTNNTRVSGTLLQRAVDFRNMVSVDDEWLMYAKSNYHEYFLNVLLHSMDQLKKHDLEISFVEFWYSRKVGLANLHTTHILELEKELEIVKIQQKYDIISDYDCELKKLDLAHKVDCLKTINSSEIDEKNKQHEIALLELKKTHGEISLREYEKAIAIIQKKPWYSFMVHVAESNTDEWEFDIDFNEYFIEWLEDNGYQLSDAVLTQCQELVDSGEYETLIEAKHSHIIEYWFKSNMTKIVAGFLRSDASGTFQSVLANSPEATIVEELAIDKKELGFEGDEDDMLFKQFTQDIKKRKTHK